MKILWLAHRHPASRFAGGAERTVHEVTSRLAGRGHDVTVACSDVGLPRAMQDEGGVRYRVRPGYVGPHLEVGRLLRECPRYDVVVDDLAHVVPWFTPQLGRVPVVAFFRHLHKRTLLGQASLIATPFLMAMEFSYPRVYRSKTFVTESRSSMNDLVHLGVPASSIRMLPPGVDTQAFRPSPRFGDPTLVFFSGLKPYKRPQDALAVFGDVLRSHPAARLIVIGDGPSRGSLEHLARKRGLTEHVEFLGRLETAEVGFLVSRAWVHLVCSKSEGWGYTASEASAAGVPTAGYAVPGLVDSVVDGVTGILVPDGDISGLAGAVVRLLSEADSWAEKCRRHGEGLTWGRAVDRWESVLEEVRA